MQRRQFPSWLARERARNLENLKQEEPLPVLWKSWSECALAATKSMLIAIRNVTVSPEWYDSRWRLYRVICYNHLRQECRRTSKEWQVRYYSEDRKLRSLVSDNGVIPEFQLRAFSEISRMQKYLAGRKKAAETGPQTWSTSSHRAVTKFRYFLKDAPEPDPWLASFRRANLLNAGFQKKDPWLATFWTIRESIEKNPEILTESEE